MYVSLADWETHFQRTYYFVVTNPYLCCFVGISVNVQCWQHNSSRSRSSSSSSDDDQVFRSESDESSDIEVLGNGSQPVSDESLADIFTHVFESWSESEMLDSRETAAPEQWEKVSATFCCEGHLIDQTAEDYVILQGYESDVSSILEDTNGELEESL